MEKQNNLNLLPKDPLSVICKTLTTPELFSLTRVCKKIYGKMALAFQQRLGRLGVPYKKTWTVVQCKQAYLWCFGNPTILEKKPDGCVDGGIVEIGKQHYFTLTVDPQSKSKPLSLLPASGEDFPIREFRNPWATSTSIKVQHLPNAPVPIVSLLLPWDYKRWEYPQKTWAFKLPEPHFAKLELGIVTPLDPENQSRQDGWNETRLERAIRLKAGKKCLEPLLDELSTQENGTKYFKDYAYNSIYTAMHVNHSGFFDTLFNHWLPRQEGKISFTSEDVGSYIEHAIKFGRTDCLEMLCRHFHPQPLDENVAQLSTEAIDEWAPFELAVEAMVEGQWECAGIILSHANVPENLYTKIYGHFFYRVGEHTKAGKTEGPINLFHKITKKNPRIRNTSPTIALAAILNLQKDLKQLKDPQIDLPPRGEESVDYWIDDTMSGNNWHILYGLMKLREKPDSFAFFAKWLCNKDPVGQIKKAVIEFVKWANDSTKVDYTQLLEDLKRQQQDNHEPKFKRTKRGA